MLVFAERAIRRRGGNELLPPPQLNRRSEAGVKEVGGARKDSFCNNDQKLFRIKPNDQARGSRKKMTRRELYPKWEQKKTRKESGGRGGRHKKTT